MNVGELLRRFWLRLIAHVDVPLLAITLAIMLFGLSTVYSATYDGSNRTAAQMMNMLLGLSVMWGVAQVPPQKLMRFGVPLYVLGVVLLVFVYLFGIKVNGSKRWLSIGITRIQPGTNWTSAMPSSL